MLALPKGYPVIMKPRQLFENQMRKNKTSLRENKNRHKNAVKDIEISPSEIMAAVGRFHAG